MNEREIFEGALEHSDPASRLTYLDESCGSDTALRARIEALLASHDNASQFLEVPALKQIQRPAATDDPTSEVAQTMDSALGGWKNVPGAEGDSDDESPDLSFLESSSKPNSIGRLGHYEVLQLLGMGAFGIVFKAFDEKLHRLVAIKAMNPQLAATSPPRKRFLREARSVAALKHENIVQVYSVEEQPLPYLVMEYIDGQTLQDNMDQTGPFDVPEVLNLGRQMASGLAAAHARGLIHRDIKPANILLENGVVPTVKITDFGLARAADDASMTRTGSIAGTPMYMAPEQAQGQTLDHRADLFSLGSVMYQMACGRPPFRAPNTVAVLKRVVDDTPRPIQEIIPEVPAWLCEIIAKLHAKMPDERFQTAKEVVDLLARCQSELQLTGKVTGVEQPVGWRVRPSDSPQSLAMQDNLGGYTRAMQSAVTSPATVAPASPSSRRPWRAIELWAFMALVGMATIGVMSMLNRPISNWLNPAPPKLPVAEITHGLNFDGKDDFVEVAALDWSYPQFTIEAFVTSARGSDNGTIVSLSRTGEVEEWMSLIDGHQEGDGKRVSGAQMKGKTPTTFAYGPLTTGVREHRALVFDGYKLHYYLNGVWQGERSAAAHEGMMWKMQELKIGCDRDGRQFFQGRIDQVRISKVARYSHNFTPVTKVAPDDSTLALYNFEEGRGDALADSSGNGHHGKIHGATWASSKSSVKTPTLAGWHGWPTDAPAPAIAPFDAAQAKQHQDEWAAYLKVPVEYTNSIGMKFRLIPPGEFMMGSTAAEIEAALKDVDPNDKHWRECVKSEAPQHKVILTQAIYLGVNEVTQKEYEAVIKATPSHFASTGPGKEAVANIETQNHPVETVSWNDAAEFCAKLSQKEELKPFYFRAGEMITPLDGTGYRLPTEAEWEFACRAGTTTKYWIGEKDDDLVRAGWLFTNSGGHTHTVGELEANPLGLYDIYGNVWEWIDDAWEATYYDQFAEKPAIDPNSPFSAGSHRMFRGSGWTRPAPYCRSSVRVSIDPTNRNTNIGFRVSLMADAVRKALKVDGPKMVKSEGTDATKLNPLDPK